MKLEAAQFFGIHFHFRKSKVAEMRDANKGLSAVVDLRELKILRPESFETKTQLTTLQTHSTANTTQIISGGLILLLCLAIS